MATESCDSVASYNNKQNMILLKIKETNPNNKNNLFNQIKYSTLRMTNDYAN